MQKIRLVEAGKQAELGTVLCKIAGNHRALPFRARGVSVTYPVGDCRPSANKVFQDDCTVANVRCHSGLSKVQISASWMLCIC